MSKQEAINRKEFLMKMGLRGGALMAVLASCGLSSCSTNGSSVSPISSITPFTIDLSSSTYAALNSVGGYVKVNDVIIARIASAAASSSFAAIARICPHEGKDRMVYSSSAGQFTCTEHNWYFKTNGQGVGNSSTSSFTVSLASNMLSVS